MPEVPQSAVTWRDAMAFDVEIGGHSFTIDAAPEHGGTERGPRPKPLLLSALAGCTAMDVVAILGKMRVAFDGLRVSASGVLADDHPRRFVSINVRYEFSGKALPSAKIARAVDLSEERYCGVRASLAPDIALTHEILVNGQPLAAAAA